ncbi:hypothetical protein FACS1894208_10510 [Clostridia bacterium]|nr:hypothetical protein FACS1894208_10510 [Clostridia bacterium]
MKPILFRTDMVRAILNGSKTQTRRVAKKYVLIDSKLKILHAGKTSALAPYQTGDILWVRETWAMDRFESYSESGITTDFYYRADTDDNEYLPIGAKWRPSIHMPREAARLFLRVTDVRVERLSDISFEDIKAEGITDPEKLNFPDLWNSTIKPKDREKYDWSANPWVWVYTFEKISREDAIL